MTRCELLYVAFCALDLVLILVHTWFGTQTMFLARQTKFCDPLYLMHLAFAAAYSTRSFRKR